MREPRSAADIPGFYREGRECLRCGAPVHGLPEDQPHLCADIERRRKRRERKVDVVETFLARYDDVPSVRRRVAGFIVDKLSGMGDDE